MNILMTPHSISEMIASVFPKAKINGNLTENGFELNGCLMTNIGYFQIRGAVDAYEFDSALKKLFETINYRQIFKQSLSGVKLDAERFSLVSPMSEWEGFQRKIYIEKKGSYADVLGKFLRDQNEKTMLKELEQLGLAPAQLESDYNEDDLQIFRNFCDQLEGMEPQLSAQIFANFEKRYPTIFSVIFKEMRNSVILRKGPSPYEKMVKNLVDRVIGQNHAAELLASTITSQREQDRNQVFLFVGPTGVGKTEMAKAVAAAKETRLEMFPMNQYQTELKANDLFGAPTGISGSADRPQLVKKLKLYFPLSRGFEGETQVYEVENAVLLFDELEKAHHQVKQSLLTLFSEGYCLINYTKRNGIFDSGVNVSEKYIFKKSLFIGTSNLYQEMILKSFENGEEVRQISEKFIAHNTAYPIATSFSPEFLGRLRVIPFSPIPKGDCYKKIIRIEIEKQLKSLKKELQCKEVKIEDMPKVLDILEEFFYGRGIDIRRIAQYFEVDLKRVMYREITKRIDDLSKVMIFLVPYDDKIGIKAVGSFYGRSTDLTDLFLVGDNSYHDLK